LFGRHFIAAHQQAGDFEVVTVNGQLQKNGGNVASYFCTAEGRVIHAVGKNVDAGRLLKEAHWAIDVYRRARQQAPKNLAAQARLIQDAHLAALGTGRDRFEKLVQREFPKARSEDIEWRRQRIRDRLEKKNNYHRGETPARTDPRIVARRRVAERLPGEQAHQLLAAEPLAPYRQVEKRMFERLSGEKYASRRSTVYAAGRQFEIARTQGRPLLLVFYQGHGEHRDEQDAATTGLLLRLKADRVVSQVLRSYVVVALPLREMAALSQLNEIPPYTFARKSSPNLLIARPDGKQVAELYAEMSAQQMVAGLWPPLVASRLAHTETLAKAGKIAEAKGLLRQILARPMDGQTRAAARERLDELIARIDR